MSLLSLDILREIDARIKSAIPTIIDRGTVATTIGAGGASPGETVYVLLDGSSVPTPALVDTKSGVVFPDDRVIVARAGGKGQWVVISSTTAIHPLQSEQLIGSVTTSGTSTTLVTFDNIPQDFLHLRLLIIGKTREAVNFSAISMRKNGDSGTNYDSLRFEWQHNLTTNVFVNDASSVYVCGDLSGTTVSQYAGATVLDLPFYSNTNFPTVSRHHSFVWGSQFSGLGSGRLGAPGSGGITKLEFGVNGGYGSIAFDDKTSFSLYGFGSST